jgi:hypothetical protein
MDWPLNRSKSRGVCASDRCPLRFDGVDKAGDEKGEARFSSL